MINILIKFANVIIDNVYAILNVILMLLPNSPFAQLDMTFIQPYLAQLNWFFPVGRALAFLLIWGACVAMYYSYQVLLRAAKAID